MKYILLPGKCGRSHRVALMEMPDEAAAWRDTLLRRRVDKMDRRGQNGDQMRGAV